MDEFLKLLAERLNEYPTAAFVVSAIVFGVIAMPKLFDLWHAIGDVRAGTRHRLAAKESLELLKLRCEIAAIRKQHGLVEADIWSTAASIESAKITAHDEDTVDTQVVEEAIQGEVAPDDHGPTHAEYQSLTNASPLTTKLPVRPWLWLMKIQDKSHFLARSLVSIPALVLGLCSLFGAIFAITTFFVALSGSHHGISTTIFVAVMISLLTSSFIAGFRLLYRQDSALITRQREISTS
tara:strand:- start:36744 stop:37457 length:714 start_codon:yes stop_codon:yes gene_type:complete